MKQMSPPTAKNLNVTFNMPPALKGEAKHTLPPYAPQKAYAVDDYPACPESWMGSSGKVGGYFVGVQPNKGMWLDFNSCFQHSHHVAVLVSVQGVNPITGQAFDASLQQFREKCPKHDIAFQHDRLCPQCGYKWPAQNYISTLSTPWGHLWIDGFKTEDGTVRQYVFTEEEGRGVAAQLIGEDRVFAIGVSFYLSKHPKPPVTQTIRYTPFSYWEGAEVTGWESGSAKGSYQKYSGEVMRCATPSPIMMCNSVSSTHEQPAAYTHLLTTKKLEVAAGAQIHQTLCEDVENLDYWEAEPVGQVVINYCNSELLAQILAEGPKKAVGGFLSQKGLLVGNP